MMEFVNGKDDIPYMKWKIKFMFQTTNQYRLLCDKFHGIWKAIGDICDICRYGEASRF